jgi:hypothetical protein
VVTGIAVPLEAAMVTATAALALGVFVERLRHRRALVPAAPATKPVSSPLAELFAPSMLGQAVERVNRRRATRKAARAVLTGRIDQIAMLRAGWDSEAREQVLGHIAAVMKAGVRREDSFTQIAGEGFTIVMPGADEHGLAGEALIARARAALDAAQQTGSDHVVAASEIEEVIFLPPPETASA